MAKMKLPFALERNNGEAVTDASEIDATTGGTIDATAGYPVKADSQTSIVGDYPTTTPEVDANDGLLLPLNGKNYSLGSVNGFGISNNIQAMTLGCTIRFTAGITFDVVVPYEYTYEDENEQDVTDYPLHPAGICGAETLECEQGSEYLLHISTIGSGSSQDPFINVFSMTELFTPTQQDNGVGE